MEICKLRLNRIGGLFGTPENFKEAMTSVLSRQDIYGMTTTTTVTS